MTIWTISTIVGYNLNENWIKKASENVSNKSKLPNHLEIDDSELNTFFNYLTKIGCSFAVHAVEKRIVLPPTQRTLPCPSCSGTGQIGDS